MKQDRQTIKVVQTILRDALDRINQVFPQASEEEAIWLFNRGVDAVRHDRPGVHSLQAILCQHDPMGMVSLEGIEAYDNDAVKLLSELHTRRGTVIDPSLSGDIVASVLWHAYATATHMGSGRPCEPWYSYDELRSRPVFDLIGRDVYAWLQERRAAA